MDTVSRAIFGRREGILVESKVRQLEDGGGIGHGAYKANDVQPWPGARRHPKSQRQSKKTITAQVRVMVCERVTNVCDAFVNMVARRKAARKVSLAFEANLSELD